MSQQRYPAARKLSSMQLAEFLQLCALDVQDTTEQNVYQKMEREAIAGAERLSRTVQQDGVSCGKREYCSHIPETAMLAEILHIYKSASPETKTVYVLCDAADGDNWIIRWMLWQRIMSESW